MALQPVRADRRGRLSALGRDRDARRTLAQPRTRQHDRLTRAPHGVQGEDRTQRDQSLCARQRRAGAADQRRLEKPLPVLVQVNGQPDPAWRVNMMPAGDGSFYLYLDGVVRKASGADVGDTVDVSLAFDPAYRSGPQDEMLPEFAARLDEDAGAKARWDGLQPSLQKEILRYLANLKSDAARQRNIDRAIGVLGGAKARFLARDWN
ncbi:MULTISPECIES: YdeI/OmpD-associated family protein [unclassified Sphingopyxis]|uniref:YdeI/OmpD-associated family protein n=1 Tax=unclassified Sphingopyxis TaxID=2614943 RepID=UPI0022B184CE|nr:MULTISPECIES: YdeI/OmpD-associated family protein [unclassified Sphingopyxis]